MVTAIAKVSWWKLTGRGSRHPLMNRDTGEPLYSVTILSRHEQDALRPLCGPRG